MGIDDIFVLCLHNLRVCYCLILIMSQNGIVRCITAGEVIKTSHILYAVDCIESIIDAQQLLIHFT